MTSEHRSTKATTCSLEETIELDIPGNLEGTSIKGEEGIISSGEQGTLAQLPKRHKEGMKAGSVLDHLQLMKSLDYY